MNKITKNNHLLMVSLFSYNRIKLPSTITICLFFFFLQKKWSHERGQESTKNHNDRKVGTIIDGFFLHCQRNKVQKIKKKRENKHLTGILLWIVCFFLKKEKKWKQIEQRFCTCCSLDVIHVFKLKQAEVG